MYQRTIIFHSKNNYEPTIRELLKKWLIPKKWQHFLRIERNVLINGKYHSFNELVHDQDSVTLKFDFHPRTESQNYLPGKRKINISYEDADVLIVNKPAGVKTHPNLSTENDSLFNDVQTYLAPGHPYMVHRIDMLTSGLVLISKTPYLVPIFNRQLTTKILHREYLAIVKLNKPIPNSGKIDKPIGSDPTDIRKQTISNNGLSAQTDFSVISKNDSYALIQLTLHSGRTHQIRIHLASMGWPIVNDVLYNRDSPDGEMMLCAFRLSYQIPFSDEYRTTEIKPDDQMMDFLTNHHLKNEF